MDAVNQHWMAVMIPRPSSRSDSCILKTTRSRLGVTCRASSTAEGRGAGVSADPAAVMGLQGRGRAR